MFRRFAFLLIVLGVAGVTLYVDRAWLASRPAVQAPAPAIAPQTQTRVLVAKGKLAAGQFVRPENLRWQAWPNGEVPADYMVEGKHKLEEFVGSVVRSGIADGEPITEGRVVRPGDRGFMAAVLTPGYRAVTVPLTATTGLAGFVFPGDRVDLLLTFGVQPSGGIAHRASETILTDLRVLAVDQRVDDQNKEVIVAKTATLEVTPKQAETIAVASELGQLSLSLRSLASSNLPGVAPFSHTWDSDATHLLPPPGATGTKSGFKVVISRGDKQQDVEFARSGR